MPQPKRVGIFAGTFDPVHNGHVAFAHAAIKAANLDKVVFLPELTPRGKQQVSSIDHRIAMLYLAIGGDPQLEVLQLPDAQFNVAKTLPKLQAVFKSAQLVMLLGSDVGHGVNSWPDAAKLRGTVEFALAVRQGDQAPPDIKATRVLTPHAHVAASHVRGGRSDETAPAVRDYIARHNLYQV